MMHTFLWNVRLWLMGISVLVAMPFVFVWGLLVDGPIALGKKFNNERDET